MKKQLLIYLALLSLGMLGCKPTEKSIAGLYRNYYNFEVSSKIHLNKDHRFRFDAQQGLASIGTKGDWKVEGRNLILNSDTAVQDSSQIYFTNLIDKDSLIIQVFWELESLPGAKLKVKTTQEWLQLETDRNGRVMLPNQFIDSLQVTSFAMLTLDKAVGYKPSSNIKLVMREDRPGNTSFKNEKWEIKVGRLIERINNNRIVYKKRKEEKATANTLQAVN